MGQEKNHKRNKKTLWPENTIYRKKCVYIFHSFRCTLGFLEHNPLWIREDCISNMWVKVNTIIKGNLWHKILVFEKKSKKQ